MELWEGYGLEGSDDTSMNNSHIIPLSFELLYYWLGPNPVLWIQVQQVHNLECQIWANSTFYFRYSRLQFDTESQHIKPFLMDNLNVFNNHV